jgi:hypothetical protein
LQIALAIAGEVGTHVEPRHVGNAGNAVVLHTGTKHMAGRGIGLARSIMRIADALDDRTRRLAAAATPTPAR